MYVIGIDPALPKPHYFSSKHLVRVGLLSLLTELKKRGHEVKAFMEEVESLKWEKLKKEVAKADLIAISTISATQPRADYFVQLIKKDFRKPVVIGGPHVTFAPEDGLKFADFVIRYEGEFALPKLIEILEKKDDLSHVPNLSWKKDGEIIHNPLSFHSPDLETDSLFPDFSIIQGWKNSFIVPIETSRGCPFNCVFCCVREMFRKVRYRKPELIVKEIKRLDPSSIFFCDDNFALNLERGKEILELMLKRLDRIPPWGAQVRISVGEDKEWLRLAKRTGCHFLCIGFESINPQSLKEMEKRQTLEEVEECLANFKEVGLFGVIHGSFIVGFDSDSRGTAKRTLNWIRKTGFSSIQMWILTPLVGTKLREKLEKEGRILTDNPGDYDGTKVTFRPKQMSPEELQKSAFSAMKRFSGWEIIVLYFLKGLIKTLKEYFLSLVNIKPLLGNLREMGIRVYTRILVKKLEVRSKKFLAQLKARKIL